MPSMRRVTIAALRHVLRTAVPVLRWLPFTAPPQEPIGLPPPRRILLLHPGHLGDMVISTSILGPIEKHFPGVEIGFVAGSWSAHALCDVAGIAHVHTLDHWRLNRGLPSLPGRWLHYRKTRAAALREIRFWHYDVAISLLDVDPDLLDVAWAAGIPVRIGWNSSFFAPLATRTVPHESRSLRHQALRQARTLLALGVDVSELQHVQARVTADTAESIQEVCAVLQVKSLDRVPYRIVHMGAGAPMKQMPPAFWGHIAASLSRDHRLLFTGRGPEEQQAIAGIIHGLPNCFDACDKLSWKGFVSAIRAAEMVYGVDSMAGHVAAAVGTPVASAYQGAGGVSRWRPLNTASVVFTNHLPCAPCLLPLGCADMACKQIDPARLLAITPVELLDADRHLRVHKLSDTACANKP